MNMTDKEIKAQARVIKKIAKRAVAMAKEDGIHWKLCDARMDIHITHMTACPLRLDDLLAADEFNFAHDVLGINRHLNHSTFKLDNHFRPRYAAKQ